MEGAGNSEWNAHTRRSPGKIPVQNSRKSGDVGPGRLRAAFRGIVALQADTGGCVRDEVGAGHVTQARLAAEKPRQQFRRLHAVDQSKRSKHAEAKVFEHEDLCVHQVHVSDIRKGLMLQGVFYGGHLDLKTSFVGNRGPVRQGAQRAVVGKRFIYMGLPLKIRSGSGSPIRAVALVEKE